MIPKEVLKQIRRIQIRTSHLAEDALAGAYQSVFRGQGIEFDEVREYQPGDDVRSIDWNVTARSGVPHVKKFHEERELTVMLLVDLSGSQRFGSARSLKIEVAAEFAAVIAYSAIKNNDKVGLIAFTDRIEKFVPPKKGSRHVLRVIREVLSLEAVGRGTDVGAALDYLNRVTPRKTVSFLVSDFRDPRCDLELRVSGRRHDLVAVVLRDPREESLPSAGFLLAEDAETGKRTVVDTGSRRVREAFAAARRREREALFLRLRRAGVDAIDVPIDRPYVEPLVRFFDMRERRLG
jgi:uncharacterized protein (DUF58 family)